MTRALHLAFMLPNLNGGGAERATLNLVQALLERGHRVDILLTQNAIIEYPVPDGARLFLAAPELFGGPEATLLSNATCRNHPENSRLRILPDRDPAFLERLRSWFRVFRSFPPDAWRSLYRFLLELSSMGKVRAIARYMEEARPDCLFANLSNATINSLLARRLIPSRSPPVVPVLRNVMYSREIHILKIYSSLLPTAPRIGAVSHAVADSLRAIVPRAAGRIVTLYNSIQLDAVTARMAAPPPHPWLEDDTTPVILAAGRLERQKAFSLLLRAFADIARLRCCRLLILGEGRQRPQLEAIIRQMHLTGRVALPGWVENPWAAMARASTFVLSSNFEGLPNVLIEALACGCPVVSTDAGGAREVLDGDRYGALVPVGDEGRLALAILRTLQAEEQATPEQRRRKREERMRRARMFSPERAAEQYLALYRELPAQSGRRP